MKQAAIWAIKWYKKLISPYLAKSCRFSPTCSEYAQEAINEHGFLRGSIKAVWRVVRCNPFSRGGYDPVIKK